MIFTEDHLRVTKVRTADGMTPLMDPNTEKTLKKIVLMPDNSLTRKLLDEHNRILPNPLKMKIERIPAYKPVPVHPEEKDKGTEVLTLKNLELETEVEKLRAQLAKALEVQPPATNLNSENESTADTKNKK